jgi:hypothetical protein
MGKVSKKIDNERKELLKLYSSQLPRNTKHIVAERIGISRQSVSCFFAGKNKSRRTEIEVLKLIAELKSEREELLKKAGLQ